ncbi:uncharacterized protein LOC114126166 [Aphis gossypii]|uniref:uncharacterized protein LOC114126166 n=1 Tax=Aphis gossypii TaxID=80765 RepID=UPI002158EBE2|nr:uncharacterized protein LOC114126166 [Aphis gossypii]
MRCCVCSNKTSKTSKISLFGIPKTDTLKSEWKKALGVRLTASSKVCRDHFKEEDIIDTWVSGQGLNKYTISLKRPKLRNGAIPINLRSFCTDSSVSQNFESSVVQVKSPNEVLISNINNEHCYYKVNVNITDDTSSLNDYTLMPSSPEIIEVKQITYFKEIVDQVNVSNIPKKWFYDYECATKKHKSISFHKLGPVRDDFTRSIEKRLIFTEDLQLLLFVYNKKINISDIGYISEVNTVYTYANLLSIIKQFDETLVCQGAIPSNTINDINSSYGYQFVESYGVWRHVKCCTILTNDYSKNRNMCVWCRRLWYIIKNRRLRMKNNLTTRVFFSPMQQKKYQQIKSQKLLMKQKYSRATKRIIFLQNKLNEIKTKVKEISGSKLKEFSDLDFKIL